ncbi:Anaphase-promoting complexsubunit CDC26 [Penicillium daleae]|uniref:Anaphase-promoting complexsubunit CDC26 n=1 Tax=Penicillium daleae TaxID=63821 RepID=A0AAD6C3T7_9EURO|nr:Anaphase-promoting complexsubunit CDC26 [Penicillium daleae]KAJ5449703.1 Anaphase-promoting complexsubunit CDC26 [Penicillium daleae]
MLRRKPTAIAITAEDIAAFEEERLHKMNENREPEQAHSSSAKTKVNPSDELKPLPGDKARILRREERIGLGHRV